MTDEQFKLLKPGDEVLATAMVEQGMIGTVVSLQGWHSARINFPTHWAIMAACQFERTADWEKYQYDWMRDLYRKAIRKRTTEKFEFKLGDPSTQSAQWCSGEVYFDPGVNRFCASIECSTGNECFVVCETKLEAVFAVIAYWTGDEQLRDRMLPKALRFGKSLP